MRAHVQMNLFQCWLELESEINGHYRVPIGVAARQSTFHNKFMTRTRLGVSLLYTDLVITTHFSRGQDLGKCRVPCRRETSQTFCRTGKFQTKKIQFPSQIWQRRAAGTLYFIAPCFVLLWTRLVRICDIISLDILDILRRGSKIPFHFPRCIHPFSSLPRRTRANSVSRKLTFYEGTETTGHVIGISMDSQLWSFFNAGSLIPWLSVHLLKQPSIRSLQSGDSLHNTWRIVLLSPLWTSANWWIYSENFVVTMAILRNYEYQVRLDRIVNMQINISFTSLIVEIFVESFCRVFYRICFNCRKQSFSWK